MGSRDGTLTIHEARLVPFALHGFLEKSSAPISFGLPPALGLLRDPRARTYWLLLGAALVTVYNLTDWEATRTDR